MPPRTETTQQVLLSTGGGISPRFIQSTREARFIRALPHLDDGRREHAGFNSVQNIMQAAVDKNTLAVNEYRGDYWQQSRRPLSSLAFVTPLLAIYEAGELWLGPQAMRNGADVWMRQLLDWLGFSQYFLLPLLTVGLLAGWHYLTRQPWRISVSVLYAKLAECVLLAVALVVIARVQGTLLSIVTPGQENWAMHASIGDVVEGVFRRFVVFVGAGIYEELLFRLMMLSLAAWLLRLCGCGSNLSLAGAALHHQFDVRRGSPHGNARRTVHVVHVPVSNDGGFVLCDAVYLSRVWCGRGHARRVRRFSRIVLIRSARGDFCGPQINSSPDELLQSIGIPAAC